MLSCGAVLDYAYPRGCVRFIGATLAQLVEQLIRNQQVVGSNPTGGSNEIKVRPGDIRYILYRLHG
jgi:hypothetical protein